jgi:hypothetical protein
LNGYGDNCDVSFKEGELVHLLRREEGREGGKENVKKFYVSVVFMRVQWPSQVLWRLGQEITMADPHRRYELKKSCIGFYFILFC